MTDLLAPRLAALLAESFALWRVTARVAREDDGRIVIAVADGRRLAVRRADPGAPFRWTIEGAGRPRHVRSVHGVLKVVRAALDAGYEPGRLRVAASIAEMRGP